jgi:hypothetical protein
MSVIIEIDAPHLLPDLVSELEHAECSAVPISPDACSVVDPRAESERHELYELRFFARAWAMSHGDVAVRLRRGN